MKTIYDALVTVEYEHRKSWHKAYVDMTCLTKSIIEFTKYPHSMDFIRKKLPFSKKGVRFRIRKIEVKSELGKSFYYE